MRRSTRKAITSPEDVAISFCKANVEPRRLLKRRIDSVIGFGVFTDEDISEKDFICEYVGEYISKAEGERRMKGEGKNFLYFIDHGNSHYCIDASNVDRIGKYINDAPPINVNAKMKIVVVDKQPRLCLFATKFIPKGVELRYSYGEKSSKLWWRKEQADKYLKPLDVSVLNLNAKSEEEGVFKRPSMKSFTTKSLDFPEEYIFTESQIKILRKIGEGSFANVFLGQSTKDETLYAVRKPKANETAAINKRHLKKTARELIQLTHHSVVLCHGIDIDQGSLIFEYCELKLNIDGECIKINSLMGLLTSLGDSLPDEWKMKAVVDILEGLTYLHSKTVVVGDLKPSNILVSELSETIVFKLSDIAFSNSCVSSLLTSSTRRKDNPEIGYSLLYLAPELLSTSLKVLPQLSQKTDIYAFGIVCHQICFPEYNFPTFLSPLQFMSMLSNGWRPETYEESTNDFVVALVKLIKLCWNANPEIRPSAKKALEYFMEITSEKSKSGSGHQTNDTKSAEVTLVNEIEMSNSVEEESKSGSGQQATCVSNNYFGIGNNSQFNVEIKRDIPPNDGSTSGSFIDVKNSKSTEVNDAGISDSIKNKRQSGSEHQAKCGQDVFCGDKNDQVNDEINCENPSNTKNNVVDTENVNATLVNDNEIGDSVENVPISLGESKSGSGHQTNDTKSAEVTLVNEIEMSNSVEEDTDFQVGRSRKYNFRLRIQPVKLLPLTDSSDDEFSFTEKDSGLSVSSIIQQEDETLSEEFENEDDSWDDSNYEQSSSESSSSEEYESDNESNFSLKKKEVNLGKNKSCALSGEKKTVSLKRAGGTPKIKHAGDALSHSSSTPKAMTFKASTSKASSFSNTSFSKLNTSKHKDSASKVSVFQENTSPLKEASSQQSEGESNDESETEQASMFDKVQSKCASKDCSIYKISPPKKYGHKMHCCPFCDTFYWKLPRHMQRKHKEEPDVKDVLKFKKKSKSRREAWGALAKRGDYEANIKALREGKEILVVARTSNDHTSTEYVPCSYCFGFYSSKTIYKHRKNCSSEEIFTCSPKESLVLSGRILLSSALSDGKYEDVHKDILSGMKKDDLHLIIRNDSLLLKYASVQMQQKDKTRYHDIKYSLRCLARTLYEFRKNDNCSEARADALVLPENFDITLESAKLVSGYKNQRKVDSPNTFLKIGYCLLQLNIVAKTSAIKEDDKFLVEKLRNFIELYNAEWKIYANNARATYEIGKANVPEEIPSGKDMQLFREYCHGNIVKLCEKLENDNFDGSDYRRLRGITLSRVMSFNARRGGEVSKLKLATWEGVEDDRWKRRFDIEKISNDVERKLAERLKLCYIEGKRKRGKKTGLVPILFTEDAVKAIRLLIKHRTADLVPSDNEYLFAAGKTFLAGWDTLQKYAAEVEEIERPDLITPSRTRKYVATSMQLLDMNEAELTWVTKHMGHTTDVHHRWYRKEDAHIELTKVAKILIALDEGKSLHNKKIDNVLDSEKGDTQNDEVEDPANNLRINNDAAANEELDNDVGEMQNEDPICNPGPSKKRKTWSPWSAEENAAIKKAFKVNFQILKVPLHNELLAAMRNYPILAERGEKKLKNKVRNDIIKCKEKMG